VLSVVSSVLVSVPVFAAPPAAAAPGFVVGVFGSGFATGAVGSETIGPQGVAVDGDGTVFVADAASSGIFKLPSTGGSATGSPWASGLTGVAGVTLSRSGRLYVTSRTSGEIIEVSRTNGSRVRTVTSGLASPVALAIDPLSGDLFVATGTGVTRLGSFEAATPLPSTYRAGAAAALAFSPDGRLFTVGSAGAVSEVSGTSGPQPATSRTVASIAGANGVAVFAPKRGQAVSALAVNRHDGQLTSVAIDTGAQSPIFTGGTRGDQVAVNAAGCLLVTQTDSILQVASGNGCPFLPVGCAAPSVTGFACNPPSAKATAPVSVPEGSTVLLDGSGSTPGLVGGTLTYLWSLESVIGRSVVLSSTTAQKPSFRADDDGTYRFKLTVSDGYQSADTTVTVKVTNVAPVVSATVKATAADGIALVTAPFSDVGIFDTYTATFNWGDGTPSTTIPTLSGTGWGYAYGAHRYATTGSFTASVYITDDDTGRSNTATAAVNVGGAGSGGSGGSGGAVAFPALWANSSTASNGLEVTGSGQTINGVTHSNREIKVSGSGKTFTGGTEYVQAITVTGSNNTFNPAPQQKPVAGFPVVYSLSSYRPGGTAAVAAGAKYFDKSALCSGNGSNRKWQPSGNLAAGLYYANCDIQFSGSQVAAANVTIVSEGAIKVSGSSNSFLNPFGSDGLLFLAGSASDKAIDLSGSGQTYRGALFAGSGGVSVSGSNQAFVCGIEAATIKISGSSTVVNSPQCPFNQAPPPTVTVAATPFLVPTLTEALTVDRSSVVPGQQLTFTGQTANSGANLFIPGVAAVTNTTGTATVSSAAVIVERFDVATNAWVQVATTATPSATATLNTIPVPAAGVTYPTGGNQITGTQIQTATAQWALITSVPLTAAQVQAITNPATTSALRARATLTTTGGATSTIARFDDDLLTRLGVNPATITGANATVIAPNGTLTTYTATTNPPLATINPGTSVTTTTSVQVPPPTVKNPIETDAAYVTRLKAIDNTDANAVAQATGHANPGTLVSAPASAHATIHIPILTGTITGPATITGTAALNVTVTNSGTAPATTPTLTVVGTSVGAATITGLPATIAPGQTVNATATITIPGDVPTSLQTVQASLTWTAAGSTVVYGPLNPSFSFRAIGAQGDPTLGLTPANAGPNLTGTTQTVTAHAVDGSGAPAAGIPVGFVIFGPNNAASGTANTGPDGNATFAYTGAVQGTDLVSASATITGVTLTAGPSRIGWATPAQPISVKDVHGRFFNPVEGSSAFAVTPATPPLFEQNFSTISFNPPSSVMKDTLGIGPATQPFTNVEVDRNGNPVAAVAAQGNGIQAGVGDHYTFASVFNGSIVVDKPGDITVSVIADDAFILGVGGGATRVSGPEYVTPVNTAFENYPVMGGHNDYSDGPSTYPITISFPAAGEYPFELDYQADSNDSMSLVLTIPGPPGTEDRAPGRIFVTGSDPDFHSHPCCSTNVAGAAKLFHKSIEFVTKDKANPRILLVTGRNEPAPLPAYIDPVEGFTFAGYTGFDVADDGTSGQVLDLHTVNFDNYDALVIASDFGGWFSQGELDVLNARKADITSFIHDGGGLVALAEGDGEGGLTSHDQYAYLPCTPATLGLGEGEFGFQISAQGSTLGFVPTDFQTPSFDYNFAHMVFPTNNCGLDIIFTDRQNRAMALATPGTVGGPTLVIPPFETAGLPNHVTFTTVDAHFYAADPSSTTFQATLTSNQAFSQQFPSLTFNPPAGLVPGATVDPSTPGFTAVTIDNAGNATGTIPAAGALSGDRAGLGTLASFDAAFEGSLVVPHAGNTTFTINAADGFTLGIAGATAVSGPHDNTPATTALFGFPVMGGHNSTGDTTTYTITVNFPEPGVYRYELDYLNRVATPHSTLTMADSAAPAGISAGTLQITTPNAGSDLTVGDPQTITVTARTANGDPDAGTPVTVTVTGANGPKTIDAVTTVDGAVTVSYVGGTTGIDTIQATAVITGSPTVSNMLRTTWAPIPPGGPPGGGGGPGPIMGTLTPTETTTITTPTPITTTAVAARPGTTITACVVGARPTDTPIGNTEHRVLATLIGAPPASPNPTAVLDPTVLANGIWIVNLTCIDSTNSSATAETTVIVDGQLKLGEYRITYQDLTVPVQGLPISVRRTYSSLNRFKKGDFGYGWSLDYADFRVEVNREMGTGPWTLSQCGQGFLIVPMCPSSTVAHIVTVIWPTGRTETFDFTPNHWYAFGGALFPGSDAKYTARPGTTSKLEPAPGQSGIDLGADGLTVGVLGRSPYEPRRFVLVGKDGSRYLLDRDRGLLEATDRTGNTTTIDSGGITSNTGVTASFVRDGEGRITNITSPDGKTTIYTYGSDGDLASFTDPAGRTTSLTYLDHHYLNAIDNPGPGVLQTVTYDADGRVNSVRDANGNVATISDDVNTRIEEAISPDGLTTTRSAFDTRGNITSRDVIFDGQHHQTTWQYSHTAAPGLPPDLPVTMTDPAGHTVTTRYDQAANITSQTDRAGGTTTYTYDGFANPTSQTDPTGITTTFTLDDLGRVTAVATPTGTTSFVNDRFGNHTSETNPLGHTTARTFTREGWPASVTDPRGNSSTMAYDADGRLQQRTDAAGGVTRYSYDEAGNTTSVTDPLGRTETFTYDNRGLVTTYTDNSGNTTRYGYDANSNHTRTTGPDGAITTAAFDSSNRQTSLTDPLGHTDTFAYDGGGRLVTSTDTVGDQTTYTYDANDQILTKTAPARGTATYTYDTEGRVLTETNGEGETTHHTYDLVGRTLRTTDPLGRQTNYVYDISGRMIGTVDPTGAAQVTAFDAADRIVAVAQGVTPATPTGTATTRFAYDNAGNRVTVTDPTGRIASTAYDRLNRPTGTTDPAGALTTTVYDPGGRVTSTTGPTGITATFTYDGNGRRLSSTDPLGHITSATYDPAGRIKSTTDARGGTTTLRYNLGGQVTSVTDPVGSTINVLYDPRGRQTGLGDPNYNYSSFDHNAAGDQTFMCDPWGNCMQSTYDLAGRVATHRDGRGLVTTYTYDLAGQAIHEQRQESVTEPGPSFAASSSPPEPLPPTEISTGYDLLGRRTTVDDPAGHRAYTYDLNGNMTATATPQGTVTYTHDLAGRRLTMTTPPTIGPGSGTTSYAYDLAGRIHTITPPGQSAVTITHRADGTPTSMARPNGVTTSYGYDTAGRQTSIQHNGPTGLIAQFDYTLDANGNRTAVTMLTPSSTKTETYVQDAANRLTDYTAPEGTATHLDYDAAGNRVTRTRGAETLQYGYDSANQLRYSTTNTDRDGESGQIILSPDDPRGQFDANGNMTAWGNDTYTYDANNQLTAATINGIDHTYTYDSDGNRTNVDGAPQLWDQAASLPTLLGDGTATNQHTPDGRPLATTTGTTTWPLADGIGSIRTTTNSSGTPVGSADYDPWGELVSGGSAGQFGYTGEQTDTTGLVNLRARLYNPGIGRFLTRDTIIPNPNDPQSWNTYTYAANNPTTMGDPTGHFFQVLVNAAVSVLLMSGGYAAPATAGGFVGGSTAAAAVASAPAIGAGEAAAIGGGPAIAAAPVAASTTTVKATASEGIAGYAVVTAFAAVVGTLVATTVLLYAHQFFANLNFSNRSQSNRKPDRKPDDPPCPKGDPRCPDPDPCPKKQQLLLRAEPSSSDALRRNIYTERNNGNPINTGYPNDAHHIVAGNEAPAAPAREKLYSVCISKNSSANGVLLPNDAADKLGLGAPAVNHKKLRSATYYAAVDADVLVSPKTQAAVIETLGRIRQGLLLGTYPH